MTRPKHQNAEGRCLKCVELLTSACQEMQDWFWRVVAPSYPDVHVACAWRGKADQDLAVAEGKSKAMWPKSKHNAVEPGTGKPASKALDLFRLANGLAEFSPRVFFSISETSRAAGASVRWGGDWDGDGDRTDQKFHDLPHFELIDPLKGART